MPKTSPQSTLEGLTLGEAFAKNGSSDVTLKSTRGKWASSPVLRLVGCSSTVMNGALPLAASEPHAPASVSAPEDAGKRSTPSRCLSSCDATDSSPSVGSSHGSADTLPKGVTDMVTLMGLADEGTSTLA